MSICFPYRPIIFIHWWWIQTTRREVPKTGRKSYVAVLPRGFLTAKAFKHPIVHSCCFNLSFSLPLSPSPSNSPSFYLTCCGTCLFSPSIFFLSFFIFSSLAQSVANYIFSTTPGESVGDQEKWETQKWNGWILSWGSPGKTSNQNCSFLFLPPRLCLLACSPEFPLSLSPLLLFSLFLLSPLCERSPNLHRESAGLNNGGLLLCEGLVEDFPAELPTSFRRVPAVTDQITCEAECARQMWGLPGNRRPPWES